MTNVNQQRVYVLHTRPYSESSLIVDFFSREHGRLRVMVKGGRRQRNYRSGLIMPFKELLVGWTGRGNLPVLTSIEQISSYLNYGLEAISCGYYLNELVTRFLHLYDAHETLYDYYTKAIHRLIVQTQIQQVLRIFEKQLLSEIGYGLVLDHDINGDSIKQELQYTYLPEHGPTRDDLQNNPTGMSVGGATLLALGAEKTLQPKMLSESRRLLRYHIDRRLAGRPLNSRRVMLSQNKLRKKLIVA